MNKFLLEDFAGGAVAERIGSAIQRVYENIANPNMDTEKARKLTIELTFKPDKNDRTDVDVTVTMRRASTLFCRANFLTQRTRQPFCRWSAI